MTTHGHYTPPARRVVRAKAVTNGSGDAVFTWDPPFAGPPVVTLAVEAGTGFRSARVAANTAGQTTVNVQATTGVTLLGIGVLALGTAAAGVTVHATATAP